MWERVRTNYRMKCYPKAVNQTGQHSPCAEWCTTKSKKLTLASWSQLSMWTKIQDIVAYLEGKAEGSMARGRRVPRQFTSSAGQRGCKQNSNRWRPTSQLDWRRLINTVHVLSGVLQMAIFKLPPATYRKQAYQEWLGTLVAIQDGRPDRCGPCSMPFHLPVCCSSAVNARNDGALAALKRWKENLKSKRMTTNRSQPGPTWVETKSG